MKIFKIGCLCIYLLAAISTVQPLVGGFDAWLQRAALVLLALHVLEIPIALTYIKRYKGSLLDSIALTMLFGFLHWWPLKRTPQS